MFLVLTYRLAKPLIHKLVVAILKAQQATLDGGGAPAEELRKRAITLEALLNNLIRISVFVILIFLVLAVFDLWSLVAGLGLVAAALTIAGQQIILDYLMGILILVEGQYYNGDWISVDGPNAIIEGEVEEVGLRRTTIRDTAGVVHSISNGQIRISSNWTRVYAVASVQVHVLHAAGSRSSVGDRGASWPGDGGRSVVEGPTARGAASDDDLRRQRGWRHVLGARPDTPADRWAAQTDMRRRLAAALAAEGISTARWDSAALAAVDATQVGRRSAALRTVRSCHGVRKNRRGGWTHDHDGRDA